MLAHNPKPAMPAEATVAYGARCAQRHSELPMSNLLTDEKFGLTPAQIDGVMDSILQEGDRTNEVFHSGPHVDRPGACSPLRPWLVTLGVGPAAVSCS